MLLTVICVLLALWTLYMGFKFYRRMEWDEPAEWTPDIGQMKKKEAELRHVQKVLQEARDLGKLSQSALDEYVRYADAEIARLHETPSLH